MVSAIDDTLWLFVWKIAKSFPIIREACASWYYTTTVTTSVTAFDGGHQNERDTSINKETQKIISKSHNKLWEYLCAVDNVF